MKKTVLFALILVTLLASLAGCSPKAAVEESASTAKKEYKDMTLCYPQ